VTTLSEDGARDILYNLCHPPPQVTRYR
jgi:hypothetical protein